MKSKSTLLLFLAILTTGAIAQSTVENFSVFANRFFMDSTFQRNRVQFPLRWISYRGDSDRLDTTFAHRRTWQFSSFDYFSQDYHVQVYNNFQRNLSDTDERVLSFEGVENGINLSLYFKRMNGKWYLVDYVDKSD